MIKLFKEQSMRLNLTDNYLVKVIFVFLFALLILTNCNIGNKTEPIRGKSENPDQERKQKDNDPDKKRKDDKQISYDPEGRFRFDVDVTTDENNKTKFEVMIIADFPRKSFQTDNVASGLYIAVKNPKLDNIELTENKKPNGNPFYSAEIKSKAREYVLSFIISEDKLIKQKIKIEPVLIKENSLRLKRSEKGAITLSRAIKQNEQVSLYIGSLNSESNHVTTEFIEKTKQLSFRAYFFVPPPGKKINVTLVVSSARDITEKKIYIDSLTYLTKKQIQIAK